MFERNGYVLTRVSSGTADRFLFRLALNRLKMVSNLADKCKAHSLLGEVPEETEGISQFRE